MGKFKFKDIIEDVMSDEQTAAICNIHVVKTNVLTRSAKHPNINNHKSVSISGLPRNILFDIITEYKDLAITQESLRRVKLTEVPAYHIGDEVKTAQFNEYLRLLDLGESKLEDARNALPSDVACSVVLSGYDPMMEKVLQHISDRLIDTGIEPNVTRETIPNHRTVLYRYEDEVCEASVGHISTAIKGTSVVYKKSAEETAKLDWKYIEGIVKLGHYSVLEHIPVVFTSNMSISATTQLIRHRHMISVKDDENQENEVLGTNIKMTHFTNMREIISICSERNCFRAQEEIRSFTRLFRNFIVSINEYNFMKSLLGPKCTIECTGKICLQPCEHYGESVSVFDDRLI
jgi:hypothetical protein